MEEGNQSQESSDCSYQAVVGDDRRKEVSIRGSHRPFQQSLRSTCFQLSYQQDESSTRWKTACDV